MDITSGVIYFIWALAFIIIGYILNDVYRRIKKIEKNIEKIMKHLKIE